MIANRTNSRASRQFTRPAIKSISWAAVVAVAVALAGCSTAETSIVGNWVSADGITATVLEDGSCTGMYYVGGAPLDIGGAMSCSYANGVLVVTQPPNEITYSVDLSEDTMTLTSSDQKVTFSRLGSDAAAGAPYESGVEPAPQPDENQITLLVRTESGDPVSSDLMDASKVLVEHRLDRAQAIYSSVTVADDGTVKVVLPEGGALDGDKTAATIAANNSSGFRRLIASSYGSDEMTSAGSSPRLNQELYEEFLEVSCDEAMVEPIVLGDGLEVVCDSALEQRFLLSEIEISASRISDFEASGTGVTITLDAQGAQELSSLTEEIYGKPMPDNQFALVIGNEVVFAPSIEAVLTDGIMQINGPDVVNSLVAAQLQFASDGGLFQIQSVPSQ